jgi:hypothetical protein
MCALVFSEAFLNSRNSKNCHKFKYVFMYRVCYSGQIPKNLHLFDGF